MKKFILSFFICILLSTTAYSNVSPMVDALGAVLIDYKTGRILWGKDYDKPLSMASTTKIMTAILTIENANIDDIVIVSKRASLAPEVNMDLVEGEQISLRYLLYALMLQSSNDAAIAIAEHVGGSVENFCQMMTEKAKQLGAKDTFFGTPNGLDDNDNHSTAYDMAIITRHALANKDFVDIINTRTVTAKSSKNTHSITNKNRLLNEYDGAIGVKTGFTGKAGHCFVGAAKRDDMQLISVVLASGWGNKGKEQKWIDTKQLLNYGFKNFKYENIINQDEVAGQITVDRSKTPQVNYSYKEGLLLPITQDEKANIKVSLEVPENKMAPIEKGEVLGVAKIYIGNELYKQIDLQAEANASRHDLKTSLEKVLKGFLEMGTNGEVEVILPEF